VKGDFPGSGAVVAPPTDFRKRVQSVFFFLLAASETMLGVLSSSKLARLSGIADAHLPSSRSDVGPQVLLSFSSEFFPLPAGKSMEAFPKRESPSRGTSFSLPFL